MSNETTKADPVRALIGQWREAATQARKDAENPPRLGGGEESSATYRAVAEEHDYRADQLEAALAQQAGADPVAYFSEAWHAIREERRSQLPRLPQAQVMPPERNGDYQMGYDAEDLQDYALDAIEAALRSQSAQAVPEELDSALNATVTYLEMIGLGRDTVSSAELSMMDVRRIANDTLYLLQEAWNKAAAPKPEGR